MIFIYLWRSLRVLRSAQGVFFLFLLFFSHVSAEVKILNVTTTWGPLHDCVNGETVGTVYSSTSAAVSAATNLSCMAYIAPYGNFYYTQTGITGNEVINVHYTCDSPGILGSCAGDYTVTVYLVPFNAACVDGKTWDDESQSCISKVAQKEFGVSSCETNVNVASPYIGSE